MKEPQTLLVRYDEIALKGKNRRQFIHCLRDNIQRKLTGLPPVTVRIPHGRIVLDCEPGQAGAILRRLKYVPGIASMSVGVRVEPSLECLAEAGTDWVRSRLKDGPISFCVRTRRADKRFPLTSPEVDREVGGRILQALQSQGLRVDLTRPDLLLEIEIGTEQTLMFAERVPGLHGLPVGSAGEVLGLLSGGIDSPVAMFRMIRRGCRVHAVFFDNRPFMGRGGYDKVQKLCAILNRYQDRMHLYVVPFEEIQVAIRDHCRPGNRVVLYRRMMYRIAREIAGQRGYLALVTGESLGQVASQTLENLDAVSRVVTGSVFRPLIGMDKQEIIDQAKTLGTYDISIEPQPDCCSVFLPPRPVTRARVPELEDDESRYPWQELMRQALGRMEVLEPAPPEF